MANPSRPHPNPISRQVIVEIPHNARAHTTNNDVNTTAGNASSPTRPPKRKRRRNKLEDRNIYTVSDERMRRLVKQVEKRRGRTKAVGRDVDDGMDEEGEDEEDEEEEHVGGDGDGDGDEDGTRLGSRQTSTSRDGIRSRLVSTTPALQSIPPLNAKEAILPDSDLLIAINHHATTFYHAQQLMYPRARKARLIEARLKKRRLLADQGGLEVTPVPGVGLGGDGQEGDGVDGEEGRRGGDGRGQEGARGGLRRSGRNRSGIEGDGEGLDGREDQEGREVNEGIETERVEAGARSDSDELDTDGESAYGSENLSVHSDSDSADEYDNDEGGAGGQRRARRARARRNDQNDQEQDEDEDEEDEDEDEEEESEDEDENEDENEDEKDGGSGKYKSRQRDMFRSLDGGALLTLGILLEEHLLAGLQNAGYVVDHARIGSRGDLHDGDELGELAGMRDDDEIYEDENEDEDDRQARYDHDDDDEDDGLSSD